MNEIKLEDYQAEGVRFLLNHKKAALWFNMGTGKTLTTLVALGLMGIKCNILVIAPLAIARATWVDEIKKWNFNIPTTSLIVNERGNKYTKKKRYQIYETINQTEPQIYFINRDLIVDLVEYFGDGADWPFPVVVIDEAQGFKSYKADRVVAFEKCLPKIDRLIELTGTPAPAGYLDIWTQLHFLGADTVLGSNYFEYRNKFFYPTRYIRLPSGQTQGTDYDLLPGAKDMIDTAVKDFALSADNSGLDLPPFILNDIHLSMSDKVRKLYDKLKSEQVLQFFPDGVDNYTDEEMNTVIAENAGVLRARLRQMASGAVYVTDDDGNRINTIDIHNEKISMTQEIINRTDSPVLVFYYFNSDLEKLKKHIKGYDGKPGIAFDKTPEMIHAWNEGKISVMFLQPQSAGHGLNLQECGHTMIWYTLPDSLEYYEQANARLYRKGQKNTTVCHRLIMDDTFDEPISELLQQKKITQNQLIDAVRVSVQSKLR